MDADDAQILACYSNALVQALQCFEAIVPQACGAILRFRLDCVSLQLTRKARFDWSANTSPSLQLTTSSTSASSLPVDESSSTSTILALQDLAALLDAKLLDFVRHFVYPLLVHHNSALQRAAAEVCARASHLETHADSAVTLVNALGDPRSDIVAHLSGLQSAKLQGVADARCIGQLASLLNHSNPEVAQSSISALCNLMHYNPSACMPILRRLLLTLLDPSNCPQEAIEQDIHLSQIGTIIKGCPELVDMYHKTFVETLLRFTTDFSTPTSSTTLRAMQCLSDVCESATGNFKRLERSIFQVIERSLLCDQPGVQEGGLKLLNSFAGRCGYPCELYRGHSWLLERLVQLIEQSRNIRLASCAVASLGFLGAADPLSSPVVCTLA